LSGKADFSFNAIHLCGASNDAARFGFEVVIDAGVGAAGFDFQGGVVGDDVAPAAGVQFADVDA